MDTYQLDLSFSEIDSLKAAMVTTMSDLDKCHDMLNARLDSPLTPELYNQYMEYLSNVTRDKNNMRSILSQAESIS
jgi:methyl coenzyme M reductase alpha subunit